MEKHLTISPFSLLQFDEGQGDFSRYLNTEAD